MRTTRWPGSPLRLMEEVEARMVRIRDNLRRWSQGHLRKYPWREPPRSPYSVMLAELLLKRTTATAVARLYPKLLQKYPGIDSLARADMKSLEEEVAVIGLRKQRVAALKGIVDVIAGKYGGELPSDDRKLQEVPHIGPYTAGAILSFGFGIPTHVVDSNVERILKRVFSCSLDEAKLPKELLWMVASKLVPSDGHEIFNWSLLDLGALVCTYRKPKCYLCPLAECCDTAIRALSKGNETG